MDNKNTQLILLRLVSRFAQGRRRDFFSSTAGPNKLIPSLFFKYSFKVGAGGPGAGRRGDIVLRQKGKKHVRFEKPLAVRSRLRPGPSAVARHHKKSNSLAVAVRRWVCESRVLSCV